MKATVTVLCFFYAGAAFAGDCPDARYNSEEAYKFARRAHSSAAYKEEALQDISRALKKAQSAVEAAEACGCADDGQSYLNELQLYAKRMAETDDIERYLRRFKSRADDLQTNLARCKTDGND